MRLALPVVLSAAFLAASEKDPYCLNDPSWSDRLLVVQEFQEGDDLPWEIKPANQLDVLKTDVGEVFRPDVMFTPEVVLPGQMDPRSSQYATLEEGTHLIVWKLARPAKPWKSIERLAGMYEITHGGQTRWVPIPMDLELGADATPWEDPLLREAGFSLKAKLEEVRQLQVAVTTKSFDFDEVVLRDGAGDTISARSSSMNGDTHESAFELGERDLSDLELVVRMGEGVEHVLERIPDSAKPKRAKGSSWKKAGLQVETRVAQVPRFSAKGSGDFDLYRSYRWLSSKGEPLDEWPQASASGGGKSFSTECLLPDDLPKGARLELGLLLGAKTEKLRYEHLDVPAPR